MIKLAIRREDDPIPGPVKLPTKVDVIEIRDRRQDESGGTTFDPKFKVTTITFDPKITKGYGTGDFAEICIHEGWHGIDVVGWGRNPQTEAETWTTEHNAYRVQSYVPQGLGVTSGWRLWDPGWKGNPQAEINRQQAIELTAREPVKAYCGPGGCRK